MSALPNNFAQLTFGDLERHSSFQDYRKLICYTRPIGIFLEYLYSFPYLRLWLCDTFDVRLGPNDDIFSTRTCLESFLYRHKALETFNLAESDFSLAHFLSERQSARNAIFLPYFNVVNGVKLASTLILEQYNQDDKTVLVTNLRMDDFYIRRRMGLDPLVQKVYFDQGTVTIEAVDFTDSILRLGQCTAREVIDQNDLVAAFVEKVEQLKGKGPPAARIFPSFLEQRATQIDEYAHAASNGVKDILMHKVWHHLLFAYSPFLAFINCAHQYNALHFFVGPDKAKILSDRAVEIRKREDVVKNLALLFGSAPTSRSYDRFAQAVAETAALYFDIESHLFKDTRR